MPCRDYDPEPDPTHAELAAVRKRLDTLTQLMCDTGKDAEAQGYIGRMRGDFLEWWRQHKKADAIREAAEAKEKLLKEAKQAALGKLTIIEIEALAKYGLSNH